MHIQKYFQQNFNAKNLGAITWSHAVNSKEKLCRTLLDDRVMFIESDIRVSPRKTAVAAHPPDIDSDLTFEELAKAVSATNKGFKIDFKDPQILVSCLNYLRTLDFSQPILLNADIFQGNGADVPTFVTKNFINLCADLYPAGIL